MAKMVKGEYLCYCFMGIPQGAKMSFVSSCQNILVFSYIINLMQRRKICYECYYHECYYEAV